MKTRIAFVLVILVILWVQVALAAQSMGQQWEDRQQWAKAADSYAAEAAASSDLDRKAELLANVARCYLKDGNITAASWTINSIREYSANRGATLLPPLMAQFETAGWQAANLGDFKGALQALTIVLEQNPGKRLAFADKAYAKGYKDLAYQLNSTLKEFDCKAMRTKALNAVTTQAMVQQLAATKGMCTSAPTEAEQQAFSAKALAEPDDLVALNLYEQIKSLWGYLDAKGEARMLTYGQAIARIEGREVDVDRIRQILPEGVVKEKLPISVSYPAGKSVILSTKGGERTAFLIAPAVIGRVQFMTNGCLYTAVLEDGQRFNFRNKQDLERFQRLGWLPKFYVVAAPEEQQPKNLPTGVCLVGVEITSN